MLVEELNDGSSPCTASSNSDAVVQTQDGQKTYTPDEFALALRSIAEGDVDLQPLITGTVEIEGIPQAFEDLAHPDAHAKILITP